MIKLKISGTHLFFETRNSFAHFVRAWHQEFKATRACPPLRPHDVVLAAGEGEEVPDQALNRVGRGQGCGGVNPTLFLRIHIFILFWELFLFVYFFVEKGGGRSGYPRTLLPSGSASSEAKSPIWEKTRLMGDAKPLF